MTSHLLYRGTSILLSQIHNGAQKNMQCVYPHLVDHQLLFKLTSDSHDY